MALFYVCAKGNQPSREHQAPVTLGKSQLQAKGPKRATSGSNYFISVDGGVPQKASHRAPLRYSYCTPFTASKMR